MDKNTLRILYEQYYQLKDKLKEYVKLGRENNDMVQLYI